MRKQKVIFRADGNAAIGMGHFIRSLALAEMLKDSFECIYATISPTKEQTELIDQVCASQIALPEDVSHYEVFKGKLVGNEIVCIDSYLYPDSFKEAIRNKLGCKLVVIEDFSDKYQIADIVINHSCFSASEYNSEPYTKLLLGFEYALLRPQYFQGINPRNLYNMSHVFLCFGAADPYNLTCKHLLSLLNSKIVKKVTIVIGISYSFKDDLMKVLLEAKSTQEVKIYQGVDATGMVGLLGYSDFAIVPASTILYEVISQGLPVFTGYYVENQKHFSEYLTGRYPNLHVLGNLKEIEVNDDDIVSMKNDCLASPMPSLIGASPKKKFIKAFSELLK
jgi:UDP-2,4-diacetamido-2,4,6-trideoxy-beta-L-altropyranose hydrolase